MATLTMLFVVAFSSSAWYELSDHNWWIGLTLLISSIFFVYSFALDKLERDQVNGKIFFAKQN